MSEVLDDVIEFSIETPRILYPAVYAKKGLSEFHKKHSVSFALDLVPPEVFARLHPRAVYGKEVISARSNIPPLVTERRGRYDLLVMIFQEADVRNVPRDLLLSHAPAKIDVKTFQFSQPVFGSGTALTLIGVTVDVDDLRAKLKALTNDK